MAALRSARTARHAVTRPGPAGTASRSWTVSDRVPKSAVCPPRTRVNVSAMPLLDSRTAPTSTALLRGKAGAGLCRSRGNPWPTSWRRGNPNACGRRRGDHGLVSGDGWLDEVRSGLRGASPGTEIARTRIVMPTSQVVASTRPAHESGSCAGAVVRGSTAHGRPRVGVLRVPPGPVGRAALRRRVRRGAQRPGGRE
jgi:hypothetical protein